MSGNIFTWRLLALGIACVLVTCALAAVAAPAAVLSAAGAPRDLSAPLDSPAPAALPLAAERFGWFWTFLENTLHSRARLLQFGVIGMFIALYFMYRACR